MRRFKFALLQVCALAILSFVSQANAYIELNLFYGSDGLTTTGGAATSSRTFIEGAIGFAIDKKGDYLVGWNYSMLSTSDSDGSTTTAYASTQMGPRFLFMLNKAQTWSLGLGYYLVTTAAFDNGGTAEKWKGTAFKVDTGYSFEISDNFFTGLRINYSSASYTESFIGESYTAVSYTKTALYPSVYAMYSF